MLPHGLHTFSDVSGLFLVGLPLHLGFQSHVPLVLSLDLSGDKRPITSIRVKNDVLNEEERKTQSVVENIGSPSCFHI